MTNIITVSLTDQDAQFLKDLKHKGSKASDIFRQALNAFRKIKDFDARELEYQRGLNAAASKAFKLRAFIESKGLLAKYEKMDQEEIDTALNEVK